MHVLDIRCPLRFLITLVISCLLIITLATYADIMFQEVGDHGLADVDKSLPVFSYGKVSFVEETVRRMSDFYRFGW